MPEKHKGARLEGKRRKMAIMHQVTYDKSWVRPQYTIGGPLWVCIHFIYKYFYNAWATYIESQIYKIYF